MAVSRLIIQTIKDTKVAEFRDSAILDTLTIDAIAQELYALVDEQACRRIIVDFTKVKMLSSQALGMLITLHKKAQEIKGEVVLCGLAGELSKVFKIMNLHKLFKTFKSERDALASFDIYIA